MCTGEEPLFRIEFQLDLNIHPEETPASTAKPLQSVKLSCASDACRCTVSSIGQLSTLRDTL